MNLTESKFLNKVKNLTESDLLEIGKMFDDTIDWKVDNNKLFEWPGFDIISKDRKNIIQISFIPTKNQKQIFEYFIDLKVQTIDNDIFISVIDFINTKSEFHNSMKRVRNFQYLKYRYIELKDTEFLTITIQLRKKDGHKNIKGSSKFLKTYTISKNDDFSLMAKKIFDTSLKYNARVYINVNNNDINLVKLKMINNLSNTSKINKSLDLQNVFLSACSTTSTDNKTNFWMLDIDIDKGDVLSFQKENITFLVNDINEKFRLINSYKSGFHMVHHIVPTKNGYHIIFPNGEIAKYIYEILKKYNLNSNVLKKNDMTLLHWN